jgi:hypothetical protein
MPAGLIGCLRRVALKRLYSWRTLFRLACLSRRAGEPVLVPAQGLGRVRLLMWGDLAVFRTVETSYPQPPALPLTLTLSLSLYRRQASSLAGLQGRSQPSMIRPHQQANVVHQTDSASAGHSARPGRDAA